MTNPKSTLPILLTFALTWGCGPSDEYCSDVESAASQVVIDTISGDQTCTVDEDCEVVGVNGSCFDNCSWVIAVENRDAFDAALQQAEDEHCIDYDGCTLIVPPCAPVNAGVCSGEGMCVEG